MQVIRGEIQTTPLRKVLRHLRQDRRTGTVYVRNGSGNDRRRIFFVSGEIRGALRSSGGETLGRRLVRGGMVDEIDIARAMTRQCEGLRIGQALVAVGAVDAACLEREACGHAAGIVHEATEWGIGSFRFVPGANPVPSDVGVAVDLATVLPVAHARE